VANRFIRETLLSAQSAHCFLDAPNRRKVTPRTMTTDKHEGLRRTMRIKMEQEEAKEIYKRRKVIVEPVFGQIKNGGFRGFSLRGKEKVAGESSLVCAGHNIKKMSRVILKKLKYQKRESF